MAGFFHANQENKNLLLFVIRKTPVLQDYQAAESKNQINMVLKAERG